MHDFQVIGRRCPTGETSSRERAVAEQDAVSANSCRDSTWCDRPIRPNDGIQTASFKGAPVTWAQNRRRSE